MKRLFLILSLCVFSLANAQNGLLNGTGYAPNFTVTDLNGNTYTIYDYLDSGYVMVLELMSVSCGHCQSHAAGTENSYIANGPSGTNVARFLGLEVNPSTDSTAVANFASTYNVTFPIANNVSPTAINYELYYTPGYYVIYPDYTYTTICAASCVTAQNYITIEGLLNASIAAWTPPVYGCMDSTASNYDQLATVSNDSCDYTSYTITTIGMSFSPDTIVCDVGDTISFILGGSHNAVEVSDSTWLAGGNTPLSGGFSFGYGTAGMYIPDDCHTFYYVCQPHSQAGMKGVIIAHHPPVFGCTDSLAFNYDSLATVDDGTCTYTYDVTFQLDMSTVDTALFTIPEINGTFNNWCGPCAPMSDPDGDNIWDYTIALPDGYYEFIYTADSVNIIENLFPSLCTVSGWGYTNRTLNIVGDTTLPVVCWESCWECNFIPVLGCTSPIYCNYNPLATIYDGSCAGFAGCMDPLYAEYDSIATCDDGSCSTLSTCNEDAPTGLYASNVVHNRATINWDNINSNVCSVDQYRIQYREVGASSWSQKTMSGPVGSCNFASQKTDKLILNLTANTNYEYQ
ncbi:MAG: hypothetical protein CMD28_04455, partial [Flavobacteriales bacterium]|nr:hypothetical protein [Flavobacteriales bacterium]